MKKLIFVLLVAIILTGCTKTQTVELTQEEEEIIAEEMKEIILSPHRTDNDEISKGQIE